MRLLTRSVIKRIYLGLTVGEGLQYYLLKEIPTDNQLYIDAETKRFFEVG